MRPNPSRTGPGRALAAALGALALAATPAARADSPRFERAPVFWSGTWIRMYFDEDFDQDTLAPRSAFQVTSGGRALAITRMFFAREDVIQLGLSPAAERGERVVVTYTDPSPEDDAVAFQDENGVDLASFTTGEDGLADVENHSRVDGPGPVRVSFFDPPGRHDGRPFTFRIRFSRGMGVDADAIAAAFNVDNGEVTAVTPVAGSTREWDVTVTPDTADRTVLVTLPAASGCTGGHWGLCTGGGRPLAYGASASVEGTPAPAAPAAFSAALEEAPAEHDGESPFTLTLRLSEAPKPLGFRRIRDHVVHLSDNAALARVARVTRSGPTRNQAWRLTVRPTGPGPITVGALPTADCAQAHAICTPDDRALQGRAITVPGPAVLSVAPASVREAQGATLDFVVTLSRAREEGTAVDYATADGTAVAGPNGDYAAASGTLAFAPGETAHTVSVAVHDDAHDEGPDGETMTLALVNPSGARLDPEATRATGTITNTDPMPKAWIGRFGRSAGEQLVDALGARFAADGASHLTMGGMRFDADARRGAAAPGRAGEDLRTPGTDALLRTGAFQLSAGPTGSGATALTAWGRVAAGGFEGEDEGVRTDGDVTSALVGADVSGARWTAGVALAHTRGEGGYTGTAEGDVEATLTTVAPYARLALTERVHAWGTAGVGAGELTVAPGGSEALETDLRLRLGAAGLAGRVLDGSGPSGLALTLEADWLWTRTESDAVAGLARARAETRRLRLALDAERVFTVGEGATLTPSGRLALRHDGGDAERGAGVEAGAGMRYASGPLSLEGSAHTLLAHQAGGFASWGASAALRLAPGASGRGLSLTLAPAWGAAPRGTEALWASPDPLGLHGVPSGRVDAELGYGLRLGRAPGLLRPYAALILGEERTWRGGARWRLAPGAAVALEATHRAEDTGFMLRGHAGW